MNFGFDEHYSTDLSGDELSLVSILAWRPLGYQLLSGPIIRLFFDVFIGR